MGLLKVIKAPSLRRTPQNIKLPVKEKPPQPWLIVPGTIALTVRKQILFLSVFPFFQLLCTFFFCSSAVKYLSWFRWWQVGSSPLLNILSREPARGRPWSLPIAQLPLLIRHMLVHMFAPSWIINLPLTWPLCYLPLSHSLVLVGDVSSNVPLFHNISNVQ